MTTDDLNLSQMTDAELKEFTHKMASDVSYHNAAEGQAYFDEGPARDIAFRKYKAGREAMKERGLEWVNKNYLI